MKFMLIVKMDFGLISTWILKTLERL